MITRQGATYHHRRRVPDRLRPIIGLREIWVSLRTTDRATARDRAGALLAPLTRILRDAEAAMAKRQTAAEIAALARRAIAAQRDLMEMGEAISGLAQAEAGWRVAQAEHGASTAALAQCEAEMGQAEANARAGRADTAARALATMVAGGAAPAPDEPPASDLLAYHWHQRRTRDQILEQIIGQERTTVRLWLDSAGDRPYRTYSRGDVTTWLAAMRRLPRVYGRSPRDRTIPLADLIKRATASGEATLSEKTVKRHMSALTQLFRTAVDRDRMTVTGLSEITGLRRFRTGDVAPSDQRDAWTDRDLQTLLTSDVWQHGQPRRAKWWIPIIILFTGARVEEIAALCRRDIISVDGVDCIRLTTGTDEDGTRRRLKTASARRTVPVHPTLIRLGLLDHVRQRAPRPDDALWPDLARQGPDGKRGGRLIRWMVTYRRGLGLCSPGVGLHSLRHTAITRLGGTLLTEVDKRARDHLMGHARAGSESDARYDKGPPVAEAHEVICRLEYPALAEVISGWQRETEQAAIKKIDKKRSIHHRNS